MSRHMNYENYILLNFWAFELLTITSTSIKRPQSVKKFIKSYQMCKKCFEMWIKFPLTANRKFFLIYIIILTHHVNICSKQKTKIINILIYARESGEVERGNYINYWFAVATVAVKRWNMRSVLAMQFESIKLIWCVSVAAIR